MMSARVHRHWCSACDADDRHAWDDECTDACPLTDRYGQSTLDHPAGPPRLCDEHARAAWVRVCEIVSACVIAACVEDWALSSTAAALDFASGLPTDEAGARCDEARAALGGWESVEAMREGERR